MTEVRQPPASRLRRLAQTKPAPPEPAAEEACELCAEPIPPDHRHLLDLQRQKLLCACRPCSILFDSGAAGGGHYRLVPDRARYIADFDLDEALWDGLRLPVDIAFFFRSTPADRVVAFYPSPLGPTESLLELSAWGELETRNPVLGDMQPDVEALLVHRAKGAREHWLAPVDRCYALVGLIRTRWKGFGGGTEVWNEMDRFFSELARGGRTVTKDGVAGGRVSRPLGTDDEAAANGGAVNETEGKE